MNSKFLEFFTVDRLLQIVRLAILLLIGMPLLFLVGRWIKKYISTKFSAQQGMIISKVVIYIGMFIIFFNVLEELGFKLNHLLGAAGIIGLAVGFASQTSVSNIISGLFLIVEKPFEVDDLISVGDKTGLVLSIDILSIKLRTFDNKYVRIPNETIIKSDVINITRFPIRRVDINVGVAYKEDIGRVRDVLLDIARQNPYCLNEPEPLVIFVGYGNSSLDFLFAIWALKTEWLTLKNSITEQIKLRFDAEGIEIPFPHVSLYSGSVTTPFPIEIVEQTKKMSGQSSKQA
ncbi:mechanosensitive ion channel family protein [candidate division KSB1 bacterium]|nr:mechanosensitive ion channel family protein [candidate division KSB1 bacterium]